MPVVSRSTVIKTSIAVFLLLNIASFFRAVNYYFDRKDVHFEFFQGLTPNYDLLCYRSYFSDFGTATFLQHPDQLFNYPPLMAVCYRLFYQSGHPVKIYVAITLCWMLLGTIVFAQAIARAGGRKWVGLIGGSMFLFGCFPAAVLLELENLELMVWITSGVGVWGYVSGRKWLAAVCFGLAGALKYYPLILLGVFPLREWKTLAVGLAAFCISTWLSLLSMGPPLPVLLTGFRRGTTAFTSVYIHNWRQIESGMDHSFFAQVKLALIHFGFRGILPDAFSTYLLTAMMGGAALYFVRIVHLPTLNRLLVLTVAAVWLAPLSHDYTLVNLSVPLAVVAVFTFKRESFSKSWAIALVCFAILFAHLTFLEYETVRYGGFVRSGVLAVLFTVSLLSPLRSDLDGCGSLIKTSQQVLAAP